MKELAKLIGIFTLLLMLAFSMASCGGGGDGDTTPTPPSGSSNWDEMVWDQDNWG